MLWPTLESRTATEQNWETANCDEQRDECTAVLWSRRRVMAEACRRPRRPPRRRRCRPCSTRWTAAAAVRRDSTSSLRQSAERLRQLQSQRTTHTTSALQLGFVELCAKSLQIMRNDFKDYARTFDNYFCHFLPKTFLGFVLHIAEYNIDLFYVYGIDKIAYRHLQKLRTFCIA